MKSWLKGLIVAGLVLGAGLTVLGLLARWWSPLDLVNDGLPFTTLGAIVLLALAAATRDWRLALPATVLVAVNILLVGIGLSGSAMDAPPDSPRFLRLVTFNLWNENSHMDEVARFLAATDADVVVLQEAPREHAAALRQALQSRYPFTVGDTGIVMLSKYPILAEGRIDRPGYPPWISLLLRWAKLDVNGTTIELAGVHLTRPFYPELQQQDIASLISFATSRSLPLVMAGDFNMSPWAEKLQRFERSSGLARYNSFDLTWPMERGDVPLLPFVAIDNVFTSPSFAKISVTGGPRLGSDHRPIIADLALAKPAKP